MKEQVTCVDDYIKRFPEATQVKLYLLRTIVLSSNKNIQEKLSWGAPTYYLNGYLLQFAAYKHHIGFYTSPKVIEQFKKEVSTYKTNYKNTMQIPLDQELPEALIKDMVMAQVNINLNKNILD